MKRILVCSDLHGENGFRNLQKAIRKEAPFDLLFCCGDIETDTHRIWAAADGAQCFFVAGNCDGWSGLLPDEVEINVEDLRFFMVHGHHFGVRDSTAMLVREALKRHDNVVLFGHTHLPLIEDHTGEPGTGGKPLLVLNPGSIGLPYQKDRLPAYSMLTVDGDRVTAKPCRIR